MFKYSKPINNDNFSQSNHYSHLNNKNNLKYSQLTSNNDYAH